MPVHSSVLGSTNTEDAEAAAVRWERKKNPVNSLLLGETNTEDVVNGEGSISSSDIKAVLLDNTGEAVARW